MKPLLSCLSPARQNATLIATPSEILRGQVLLTVTLSCKTLIKAGKMGKSAAVHLQLIGDMPANRKASYFRTELCNKHHSNLPRQLCLQSTQVQICFICAHCHNSKAKRGEQVVCYWLAPDLRAKGSERCSCNNLVQVPRSPRVVLWSTSPRRPWLLCVLLQGLVCERA